MRRTIRKLALANALKFKGTANPKAIIGGLIKEHPEAKQDMKNSMRLINEIVEEVNSTSLEQQEKQLLELDPEHRKRQESLKQQRKEQAKELPALPNAEEGKVVTRMPPEPSKYPHLGHAMSFLINYLYAKMYKGKVVLRLDDTNPEKSKQEFVDVIKDDVINYLEAKPDKIVLASDHLDEYYAYAEQLINRQQAYVCSCQQEDIKKMRRDMQDCPHRNQSLEETKKLWEQMKAGSFKEGTHVLRLKIDMQHKNAVMRDPVIYRLSYQSHYKEGIKYKVWPMYDFESTVEEELCGVTHVMRGNEFDTRIELQDYIGNLLGFKKVTFKHYGRFTVQDATTQGREIRELIESSNYIGWDDPRLVTLRALKRRGIIKESYYELAKQIGMSKQLTTLDFSVIAAINRNLLDKQAKRFFAVKEPVIVKVNNIPDDIKEFRLSYHPDEDKGERVLAATHEYYIEKKDNDAIKTNTTIRLMDAMNLRKIGDTTYEFVSQDYESFRLLESKGPLIHFVPKDGHEVNAELFMPDITRVPIVVEPNIMRLEENDVVQFERYAFCRLDKKAEKPVFWYAHD